MSAVGSLVQHIVLWYNLGVGISIVVLDTYAILVEYLAQENSGREKNDKSVVCVVCCKKPLSTNNDFPNGKYEMCICRNRYVWTISLSQYLARENIGREKS